MIDFLEAHGLELIGALASLTAAVVSVLVYRRQRSTDDVVGWIIDRSIDDRITLVRTGGGTALEVQCNFDEACVVLSQNPPPPRPIGPKARVPVARTAPSSDFIAPGYVEVTWKQKRRSRTTDHSWWSQLPG